MTCENVHCGFWINWGWSLCSISSYISLTVYRTGEAPWVDPHSVENLRHHLQRLFGPISRSHRNQSLGNHLLCHPST